jgi:hypothetical protein
VVVVTESLSTQQHLQSDLLGDKPQRWRNMRNGSGLHQTALPTPDIEFLPSVESEFYHVIGAFPAVCTVSLVCGTEQCARVHYLHSYNVI